MKRERIFGQFDRSLKEIDRESNAVYLQAINRWNNYKKKTCQRKRK
ncbi:MAG: hypothetical protein LBJ47_09890 [Tannerella sp.]|jgi:hypothetical protein|nr:hypothetical protein [Tannerella sp.]